MSAEVGRKWELTPDALLGEIDAYDGGIAYMDAQLEALSAELDADGLLDETLLVITSDHGEEFGEHDLFSHGNSLYSQVTRVPLLIRLPTVAPAGARVPGAVALQDLAATIADLTLGVTDSPFPGASLRGAWSDPAAPRADVRSQMTRLPAPPEWYLAGTGPIRAVARGALHYIRWGNDAEELYDLDLDPLEASNLVGDEAMDEALLSLREASGGIPID
jgi:arylsulfatase A-like enzyme